MTSLAGQWKKRPPLRFFLLGELGAAVLFLVGAVINNAFGAIVVLVALVLVLCFFVVGVADLGAYVSSKIAGRGDVRQAESQGGRSPAQTARMAPPLPGGAPVPEEPAAVLPQVQVLVIGPPGSGKTVFLASLYRQFRYPHRCGIRLVPDDRAYEALQTICADIEDSSKAISESTLFGDTDTWTFTVRVESGGIEANVCTVSYLNHPGELQGPHPDAGSEDPEKKKAAEKFGRAVDDADVLLGVLDGSRILKIMKGTRDPKAEAHIKYTFERLVKAKQKSIHLIISKWDQLIDDATSQHYRLEEVKARLGAVSWDFADFVASPRFKTMRIIPVSALGMGFARPGPDGIGMDRNEGAQWRPENVDLSFLCLLPDILKKDGIEANALFVGRRRALVKNLDREHVADISVAVVQNAILRMSIVPPFASLEFDLWRVGEQARTRRAARHLQANAPMAHVLKVCYAAVAYMDYLQLG